MSENEAEVKCQAAKKRFAIVCIIAAVLALVAFALPLRMYCSIYYSYYRYHEEWYMYTGFHFLFGLQADLLSSGETAATAVGAWIVFIIIVAAFITAVMYAVKIKTAGKFLGIISAVASLVSAFLLMLMDIIILAIGGAQSYGDSGWAIYSYTAFIAEVIIFVVAMVLGAKVKKVNSGAGESGTEDYNGFYDLGKHILLLFFTFGIWQYIWIYKVTKYLNRIAPESKRDETTTLLLCIFVPFYSIYWMYKSGQIIDGAAKKKGVNCDIATLCLILALLIGIAAPIIMQSKLNEIYTALNGQQVQDGPAQATASGVQQPAASNAVSAESVPEQLKKYKELLDMGAITQEEYDAKKKELLSL